VSRRIRVPRVVVLVAYEHLPKARVRFSRFNIYARDDSTCQYCGRRFPRSDLNLDHVVPRSRGGSTNWENVVCSCVPCNLRKGGRTPEEAGMRLLRHPARPRWTPVFRNAARRAFYREWMPFLSMAEAAYWNTELLD
jgi:5-methylcytosine-specific restriction endonuclease McrA